MGTTSVAMGSAIARPASRTTGAFAPAGLPDDIPDGEGKQEKQDGANQDSRQILLKERQHKNPSFQIIRQMPQPGGGGPSFDYPAGKRDGTTGR